MGEGEEGEMEELPAKQDLGEYMGKCQGEGCTDFIRDVFGVEARKTEGSGMSSIVPGSQGSRASAGAGSSGWPSISTVGVERRGGLAQESGTIWQLRVAAGEAGGGLSRTTVPSPTAKSF